MALGPRLRWWQRLPRRSWRIVLQVNDADEVPDRLPSRGIAIVGVDKFPKWLVFDCPCRRGHRIMLNLDSRRRPTWRVVKRRPLTTTPSIDDLSLDRCHFFIRNGKIQWVEDSAGVAR